MVYRRVHRAAGNREFAHAKTLRAATQRKAGQAQLLLKTHIEQSKAEVRKITQATLHEARVR